MTSYQVINNKNEYSCGDLSISAKEWYDLLNMPKAKQYLDALICFLREPQHKGSCYSIAKKYGNTPNYYNNNIWRFGEWVKNTLNRFSIIGTKEQETYWAIPIERGWKNKGEFIWVLRQELVEALQKFLLERLISKFEQLNNEKPFNDYGEIYKWELLKKTNGKSNLDIANAVKSEKIVYIPSANTVYTYLTKNHPLEFSKCLDNLFNEKIVLNKRLVVFKEDMLKLIPSEWNYTANDERAASALLTCKYPNTYTFYMYDVYNTICQYLGITKHKPGENYAHFLEIINLITDKYGDKIQELIIGSTKQFEIKPKNLAVQTMFWVMKDNMNNEIKKNMKFTWIPFYEELADKLLTFKNNRTELLNIIFGLDKKYIKYITNGDTLQDIDPFSVFAIFNRGQKEENRKAIAVFFKEKLNIKADIPTDFNGVPVIMALMALFFDRTKASTDIQPLWNLLDCAINYNEDEFAKVFDQVRKQKGLKWNLTMGLFWIRPYKFIALDSNNRNYLQELGFNIFKEEDLTARNYQNLLKDIHEAIKGNKISEQDYPTISFNAWKNAKGETEDNCVYSEWLQLWKYRKNIILYGAPGTGKTYDVPELVVRLCCPNLNTDHAERAEIMECYKKLKIEKRVAFTTFHQSMDYEDWIEGLRPVINEESQQVSYEIEAGIFKRLCIEATKPIITNKEIKIDPNATVWKVSLLRTGDNSVRTDCMNNNYIRIGWDYYGANIDDNTDWEKHNGQGKGILDTFINKMKVGDVVLSCYTNHSIDAIGVITGEYEWKESLPNYKRTRTVRWLVKGINEDITELNDGKVLTTGTVYRLPSISLDDVKNILDKYQQPLSFEENKRPYVMVIDEINRGNVSKIFGELITLLEVDKRKGEENEECVVLPYSKKTFSIPSNVYIIATMNTADRSLGTLDYAIRRRFAFIADKPFELDREDFNSELFEKVSHLFVKNYNEYKETNFRIDFRLEAADTLSEDFKPEDVWIGHSYFIMENEEEKHYRLFYEIIPLLEEYVRDGVLKDNDNVHNIINELIEMAH